MSRTYEYLPAVKQILVGARDLLSVPERYNPDAPLSLDKDGHGQWPPAPQAVQWSLRGSIMQVARKDADAWLLKSAEATLLLCEVIEKAWGVRGEWHTLDLFDYQYSHAVVMKAFNLAIAVADRRLAKMATT